MASEPPAPELPFPIFRISSSVDRYMLYDINVITWLRKTHHILGVLLGTLPHVPQQNVFLGLPLELMPEEARLLTDKGVAYIAVDNLWHAQGMENGSKEQRQLFEKSLAQQGEQAAKAVAQEKLERTEKAMRRLRLDTPSSKTDASSSTLADAQPEASESIFAPEEPPSESPNPSSHHVKESQATWSVTPTTSHSMLPQPRQDRDVSLPDVKSSSFAVFKQLHDHGYYMSPGLRFGCQFMAYPGDPLRYHSHFLAVSADWDEELDLIDLVGGGRLGTGVKKAFLIGGKEPSPSKSLGDEKTRTFCIEWGGM